MDQKGVWGGRLFLTLVLCALGSAAYLLCRAWPFSTDDAYITLRYADHLAQGHGIVWNIGDSPSVEGYSNFIFVLIGALSIRVGLDPILVFKSLGTLSLLTSCCLLYRFCRLWVSPRLALLPAMALTTYTGTIWWTVSGLETSFYQMLCVATALAFAAGFDTGPDRWIVSARSMGLSGLLVALLALTRPEGPIIGLALALALTVGMAAGRIDSRSGGRGLVALALAFMIPYALYLGWKLSHFGSLLPNTVLCKGSYQGPPGQLLKDFLPLAWPAFVLALPALVKKFDPRLLPCLIVPCLYGAILYYADPILGHLNRHFLSAFALLLTATAAGAGLVVRTLFSRAPAKVEAWIMAALLAYGLLTLPARADEIGKSALQYASRMAARAELAAWLNQHLSAADAYVIGDAGLVPYLTHARVIDAYCLNCREMTSKPISLSGRKFAEALMLKPPEAIVIPSLSASEMQPHRVNEVFVSLLNREEFHRGYRHVTTIGAAGDGFQYWVYRRGPVGSAGDRQRLRRP